MRSREEAGTRALLGFSLPPSLLITCAATVQCAAFVHESCRSGAIELEGEPLADATSRHDYRSRLTQMDVQDAEPFLRQRCCFKTRLYALRNAKRLQTFVLH
jgi:hypothetical protein